MPRYQYKAFDPLGRKVRGEIDAVNEVDLEYRVETMGLSLITGAPRKETRFALRKKSIPRRDLINFTFQLEQLIQAGVPIIEALHDLRDSETQQSFRDVLSTVVDYIEGGKTFAEALSGHGSLFGKVYIYMARVGEQSGKLGEVLYELAYMLKWQDELIAKAKAVTVYPSIVFSIVLSVAIFLMTYLVPQLVPFLKDNNFNIPLYTQALILSSDFITGYWLHVVLGLSLPLMVLGYLDKNSPRVNYSLDKAKITLWMIGPINLKVKLARFARHFALMYGAGVTVLDAIELSRPVMNNAVLDESLGRAHLLIQEGSGISESFSSVGLFPPLVIRMLKVGETSGNLDKALLNVSYFYERDAKESMERMEPAIMPVLTVILGGLLFWIMSSVLFPLYESLGKLS